MTSDSNPALPDPPSPTGLRRLIGNRVTEKDIREHLDRHGFLGNSARFRELELHAIRRPGWQQVFRFRCAITTRSGERQQLFGAVFDDERERTEVWWSDSPADQAERLESWSAGMLRCETTSRGLVHWILLGLFAAVFSLAVVSCAMTPQ